jgi:predicted DNA-binding protein (MmcQ/YjbR family)
MNHEQISEYALQKPGTSLRYPFDPLIPVIFVGSKMFALLGDSGGSERVNLKGNPEQNWLLREEFPEAIIPGYHMNKRHWNTVILDGTVPDSLLLQMVDESYELVFRGLPKSERKTIIQT